MSTPGASMSHSRPSRDRLALIETIRRGISVERVNNTAVSMGLSLRELTEYGVIAPRTLSHSRRAGKFSQTQSDRVIRFFRVFEAALDAFGTTQSARRWLDRPTRALGGEAPASLLDTEEGARLVEELLGRIDHGIAA